MPIRTSTNWSRLIDAAQGLLERTQNSPIRLTLREVIWDSDTTRSSVLRCNVLWVESAESRPIIVKCSKHEGPLMAHEGTIAQFLSANSMTDELAPVCLAFDSVSGILISEDMNTPDVRLLGQILYKEDEDGSANAMHSEHAALHLIRYSTLLARLHTGTSGRQDELAQCLERVDSCPRTDHKIESILECLENFEDVFAQAGIRTPNSLRSEIAESRDLLQNPGIFTALVHGDPTFGNVLFDGTEMRLIDFETAGYRHMLLDAAFPTIRYVWSAWCMRLPHYLRWHMGNAYRAAISRHNSQFDDVDKFNEHLTAACSAWLAVICSVIPEVMNDDRKWGRVTYRQRVILGLEHFCEFAQDSPYVPALVEAARELRSSLELRWQCQASDIPVYPALTDLP